MTEPLYLQECVNILPEDKPLSEREAKKLLPEVSGFLLKKGNFLQKTFVFKNFVEAIDFVNGVAEIAESCQHHPDINITYKKVEVRLSTHDIGGLSHNDFILAAKINYVLEQ